MSPNHRGHYPSSPHRGRWSAQRLLALAAGWLLSSLALQAADTSLEYRVKAGFLFNFAKFVQWPAETLPPHDPIQLGLLAPPDVCHTIEQALAGKTVAGHPLEVVRLDEMSLQAPPHIVFVHRSVAPAQRRIGELLEGHGILVVGETADFAADGGVIGFTTRGDTLRFQVNLAAAEHARLQLSGQLAGLAEIVRPRR